MTQMFHLESPEGLEESETIGDDKKTAFSAHERAAANMKLQQL